MADDENEKPASDQPSEDLSSKKVAEEGSAPPSAPEAVPESAGSPEAKVESSEESSKSQKAKTDKKTTSKKEYNLGKLKRTTTTQAPSIASAKESTKPKAKKADAEYYSEDDDQDRAAAKPISQTRKRQSEKKKEGPELDWKFTIIGLIGLMMFGLVVHIFSINGGMVLNDRFRLDFLFNKFLIQQVSNDIVRDMISRPLMQPWVNASFVGDFGEYKTELMWYHTVDVFWHAFTCGLVFIFILTLSRYLHFQKRLSLNPYHLAAAAAAIFACHPFTSQVVSYLSARPVLLGVNNYFLSLNFFILGCLLKHPIARACFLFGALCTGAMSVWSNPEMISLPAVAAFSLLLMKRPLSQAKETFKEHPIVLALCALFTIALPASGMLGYKATNAINYYTQPLESLPYALSQVKAFIFYYLRCFIAPIGLSIDPPLAIASSASDPFFIAAVVGLAALIVVLLRLRNQPVLGLASMLLFTGFITHGFILQRDTVADWVAYLPLTGAAIFMSYGLVWLSQKHQRHAFFAFTAILLLFCTLTFWRNFEWSSNFLLWKSALDVRPKSALAHAMISTEYLHRMQPDLAEKHVLLARAYGPKQVMPQVAQAQLDLAKNNPERAFVNYSAAFKLAQSQNLPRAILLECMLGQVKCLIKERKLEMANLMLQQVDKIIPQDPRLLYLVGFAAVEEKKYELALNYLQAILKDDPSQTQAWEPLVRAALALKAYDGAYEAALNFDRHYPSPESKLLLARTAIVSKRESDAEQILKQLISQEPQNARALYLMSRLYKRKGNVAEWKKYREDAVKIDADIATKYDLPEQDVEDTITIPPK
ncbi:MAG: hypothetical protein K2X77_18015 [Candidatus Obscuribacterales bacterium]|nr:hypothetical protein [Candidatus Obscuribacterales bacterium]